MTSRDSNLDNVEEKQTVSGNASVHSDIWAKTKAYRQLSHMPRRDSNLANVEEQQAVSGNASVHSDLWAKTNAYRQLSHMPRRDSNLANVEEQQTVSGNASVHSGHPLHSHTSSLGFYWGQRNFKDVRVSHTPLYMYDSLWLDIASKYPRSHEFLA